MLSEYEIIVNLYCKMHEGYGWTRPEVDKHPIEWIFDLLIVKAKTNHPEDIILPIDSVF